MEVSHHYPAAVLMTVAFALLALTLTGFMQVLFAMNAAVWMFVVSVWTAIICYKAITSTDEPEGKALA